MLDELKQRLEQAGCCKKVELGDEYKLIDSLSDEDESPIAILIFGEVHAKESEGDIGVHQFMERQLMVQLVVEIDQLVETEEAVTRALIGYQKSEHWLPLELANIKTHSVMGSHYSRLMTFVAGRHIQNN